MTAITIVRPLKAESSRALVYNQVLLSDTLCAKRKAQRYLSLSLSGAEKNREKNKDGANKRERKIYLYNARTSERQALQKDETRIIHTHRHTEDTRA